MREFVSYIMQSPVRAGAAVFLTALFPLLFWFSAAIAALVILRHGISKSLSVVILGLVPAVFWLTQGDPGIAMVFTTVLIMATTLRTFVSLEAAFFAGLLAAIVGGILVPYFMPELIESMMTFAEAIYKEMTKDADVEYDASMQASLQALMIASFSATYLGIGTVSLFLARSWQAHLYNPGGWKAEFHQFRLTSKFLLGLLVVFLLASLLGVAPALVSLVVLVPFFFAGIALVHGVVERKKLGTQWLVIFYLALVLFGPTGLFALIILALFDSGVNFRQRISVS